MSTSLPCRELCFAHEWVLPARDIALGDQKAAIILTLARGLPPGRL